MSLDSVSVSYTVLFASRALAMSKLSPTNDMVRFFLLVGGMQEDLALPSSEVPSCSKASAIEVEVSGNNESSLPFENKRPLHFPILFRCSSLVRSFEGNWLYFPFSRLSSNAALAAVASRAMLIGAMTLKFLSKEELFFVCLVCAASL